MSKVVDFGRSGIIGANLMPKRYDIALYQGDSFEFQITFKDSAGLPINISSWDFQIQIRKVTDESPGETPIMNYYFTPQHDGTDGVITFRLSDTDTAALQDTTEYMYDVQVADATTKRTYIGGKITVTKDITEWA